VVYFVLINSAVNANLEKAKKIFEEAKEYAASQQSFLQKLRNLKEFFQSAAKTLKGSKLFADEFGAKAERIKFFEGDDFAKFVEQSKNDIRDLLALNDKLMAVVKSKIFTSGEDIAPEVKAIFKELEKTMLKIKERVYAR